MIRICAMSVGFFHALVLAVPPAPVADPSGIPKNRYISMSVPDNAGEPTALRVRLVTLMDTEDMNRPDFSEFEGQYRWVGPPVFGTENDNDPTPFVAAPLQCTPYYHDWSALDLFHIYGDAVVPGSTYDVEVFDQSCEGTEATCTDLSAALQVVTRCSWADTADPCQPNNQHEFVDFIRVMGKIEREIHAVSEKVRVQLQPAVLDPLRTVNVKDLIMAMDSFYGLGYPLSPPSSCDANREVGGTAGPAHALGTTPTVKVYLTPVPAQGTLSYPPGTVINGQELIAPTGGFNAFFHFEIGDWDPAGTGPDVRGVQLQVDASHFLGANAIPPAPGANLTLSSLPCPNHQYCRDAMGYPSASCSGGFCRTPFVNSSSTDYFWTVPSFPGITMDSPAGPLVIGAAGYVADTHPVDDGNRRYLGTLLMYIPHSAEGHVYTLGFLEGTETMVVSGDTQIPEDIPVAEFVPATIRAGVNRSRFISFVPGHGGEQIAIRVKLVSLHHVNPPYSGGPSVPFDSFEGEYRWVGPPTQFVESVASAVPFYAANLQCEPHYQDWSSAGYLHVTGSAIVPSSQYEVQFVPASCMGNEDNCPDISAALLRETTRWGDVETPFNPPTAGTQPDLADVSALVNKFRNAAGAPIKARALLAGTDAAGNINLQNDLSFAHISACVDAFRGAPYPHTGPEACP